MLAGAIASAFVGFLFDGHTAFAMSSVMALFAIASLSIYAKLRYSGLDQAVKNDHQQ